MGALALVDLMRVLWVCLLAVTLSLSPLSQAKSRDFAGVGSFIANDVFATVSDDRWRTGSGALSFAWGPAEDLLELRIRGEVITPGNLIRPAANDRPYASSLSFGLHRHFRFGDTDVSLGGDLVLTGPQTRLDEVQAAIHDVIGVDPPSAVTLANQIPNEVYGAVTAEVARRISFNERTVIRPFFEAQAGVDNLLRVGGDIHFGRIALNEAMIRDVASGQRYRIGAKDAAKPA